MLVIIKHSFIALFVLAAAVATPVLDTENLVNRGATLSSAFASEDEAGGRFVLQNNLWNEYEATNGSQTSQVIATSEDSVAWTTTYTWAGHSNQVKSYANLDLQVGLGQSLASISSIPTSWQWSYANTSSDLAADVSYDLWLSNAAGSMGATSNTTFEIMIWLSARGGVSPAGHQIATANISDVSWALYSGTVGTWAVFSFVAPDEITNFTSDLKHFFTYLISEQGVPSSQSLVQLQAGTEPFNGTATLMTSSYSAAIKGHSYDSCTKHHRVGHNSRSIRRFA